jgi:hypothetical protein
VSSGKITTAQRKCEEILIEMVRYNEEHLILPSENVVANRLLKREIELFDAYEELNSKLNAQPQALHVFLDLVLGTAADWNPQKMQEARAARNELAVVNRQISSKAAELAQLLEQRSNLHNTSGFSSDTHFHVCDVIERASQSNHLFNSYVKDGLSALRMQFDLKYWPTISDLLQEIAIDAACADIEAIDPLTAVGTAAIRPSKADFFKVLFAAIEENSEKCYGFLPQGFKLTDRSLASIANCALDLAPDDLVDDEYVKRFRQRERSKAA